MEGESLQSKYGPRIANSLSPINCSYYEVTVVTAVEDDDDYTNSQSNATDVSFDSKVRERNGIEERRIKMK